MSFTKQTAKMTLKNTSWNVTQNFIVMRIKLAEKKVENGSVYHRCLNQHVEIANWQQKFSD
jgi:hypothetical protein